MAQQTDSIVRRDFADINDGRAYLRSRGLECGRGGWTNGLWRATLTFCSSRWHVAIYLTCVAGAAQ